MKKINEPLPIQTLDGTIVGLVLPSGKVQIKAGSFFRNYEVPSLRAEISNIRKYLMLNGYVDVKRGILLKDYYFDSSSAAVSSLMGSMCSGNKYFITTDNISLGDFFKLEDGEDEVNLLEQTEEQVKVLSNDIDEDEIYFPDYTPNAVVDIYDKEQSAVKRDVNKAKGALILAGFKCCINKEHSTFITLENKPYMEAHHLIPLKAQVDFKNSLDVDANIVCLCSNCHRMLHYGKDIKEILNSLYLQRKELLIQSGIDISFEQLYLYYRDR